MLQLILLLFAATAAAQIPVAGPNLGGSSSGGGASSFSGLTDFKVSVSGNVITVQGGIGRIGNVPKVYATATGTLSGSSTSTVYIYVDGTGTLTMGHAGAGTLTCSNCTTATSISAYPPKARPVWAWTYTTGSFDTSGGTEGRASQSHEVVNWGTGLSATYNADGSVTVASFLQTVTIEAAVVDFATATAVGNGKLYFVVPASLNNYVLTGVSSSVISVGTTNLTSVQLTKCSTVATGSQCSGTTASMLSTVLSIDSNEASSLTAATPAVISGAAATVTTDQVIRVDITAISTTPANGLIVTMVFGAP